MKKTIKLICLLICISICILILSGCYNSNEIEDLAYVIAIGIDEAGGNNFNLTFQTAVPKSISAEGGGGESTSLISFKTDNFLSGFKKASEYLSRKINLSHTKIIVVSENIAKKGIIAFLNGLQNYTQLRPTVRIIVSSQGAKKYIESIQPKLSANTAKYYDLLFKSFEADFLVPSTNIEEYLYRAKNIGMQPVAIYTDKDKTVSGSKEDSKEGGSGGGSGGGEGGGDKSGGEKPENLVIKGLAVFKQDKMVGKLNSQEATLYSLLSGSVKNVRIEVIDPLDDRFKVLSKVTKEKTSKINVISTTDKPKIDINLKLYAQIESVQSDKDYDKPENSSKLKKAYEDYINKHLKELLKKTTKQYKTDIFGFGETAKRKFLTKDEWVKAKWSDKFPKSEYDLKIKINLAKRA